MICIEDRERLGELAAGAGGVRAVQDGQGQVRRLPAVQPLRASRPRAALRRPHTQEGDIYIL